MTRTTRWAALVTAGAVALGGCGGGADSSSESGGAGERDSSSEARSEVENEGASAERADSSAEPVDGQTEGEHVAHTAGLDITVADVGRAGAKVRSAAATAGGYVSREEVHIAPDEDADPAGDRDVRRSSADSDHSWAEIVVTVPDDERESTLTRLARIGEVTSRTSNAQDLTVQYTDTTSRVRTLERSVARLQELIASAEDLKEIVALESELTRREADLEAMTSKKKALEKRTTTVPITVSLRTPEGQQAAEPTGFLAGLASGWDAFTAALGVGMTALGAVTPFAVTGLVLLAPLLWWLRRRRPAVSAR